MNYSLNGRNIAVLATDGVEQIQLAWSWEAMLDAGAGVDLVSPKENGIQGFNHREQGFIFPVDRPLFDAEAQDYDALLLPGGVRCPESLGTDGAALRFLRDFHELARPIAAICQAPAFLAKADLVRERRLTSWPRIRPAIRRAGGIWMNQEVVVDGGLITCRTEEDLDAFCDALIGALRIRTRRRPGRRRRSSNRPGNRTRFS